MKRLQKERQVNNDSGGKTSSASLKVKLIIKKNIFILKKENWFFIWIFVQNNNKRKCSPRENSPIEKKIDFIESGSPRQALSPLKQNTPESRLNKK